LVRLGNSLLDEIVLNLLRRKLGFDLIMEEEFKHNKD